MRPFHPLASLSPPLVAISGCLAGDNVRYDGDNKAQAVMLQTLSHCVRWLPVCPEVAAGMGIPRPPVQLRRTTQDIAVVEVENSQRDHTQALRQGVTDVVRQLQLQAPDAIVLKARSPSCGIGSTPLHDAAGAPAGLTDGLFARACRGQFSDIPLLDEAALATTTACQAFAVLLSIRADIARVDMQQRNALDSHYRGLDLDTTIPLRLAQQISDWTPQRIGEAFNALWPRKH